MTAGRAKRRLGCDRLIVGVWPGWSFAGNEFVGTFADGLQDAGCSVVDVDDPLRIDSDLDVLHIHWPEQVLWQPIGPAERVRRTIAVLRTVARLRAGGTRIVWMVHNLHPHGAGRMARVLWGLIGRCLPPLCDGFMTLSPSTIAVVRQSLPALRPKPAAAAMHPRYVRISDLPDRTDCRAHLSVPASAKVFGLFGSLKPYKGVEDLIAAFSRARGTENYLLIAGRPADSEYGNTLLALAKGSARVDIRLKPIDDREFAMCLQASDVIVLPYRRYLHSGALIHAVSYDRPVVTPATPFADDVADAVGPGWVTRYEGPLSPAVLADWTGPPAIPPALAALRPSELALAATSLYRELGRSGEAQGA